MEAGGVMEGGFEIGMLGRGWGWGCRWRGNGKLEWRNAVWCSFVSRSVRQHEDGNEGACAGLDFFFFFGSTVTISYLKRVLVAIYYTEG